MLDGIRSLLEKVLIVVVFYNSWNKALLWSRYVLAIVNQLHSQYRTYRHLHKYLSILCCPPPLMITQQNAVFFVHYRRKEDAGLKYYLWLFVVFNESSILSKLICLLACFMDFETKGFGFLLTGCCFMVILIKENNFKIHRLQVLF